MHVLRDSHGVSIANDVLAKLCAAPRIRQRYVATLACLEGILGDSTAELTGTCPRRQLDQPKIFRWSQRSPINRLVAVSLRTLALLVRHGVNATEAVVSSKGHRITHRITTLAHDRAFRTSASVEKEESTSQSSFHLIAVSRASVQSDAGFRPITTVVLGRTHINSGSQR